MGRHVVAQEIKTLAEKVVYENRFVQVYDNEVEFPSGANGTYFRTRWKAPHGVAVIPVQDGSVLLLENFRYAELSFSVEIPQGFGTYGSSPAEDAIRELKEEMGFVPLHMEPLMETGRDFVTHVYVAEIKSGDAPSWAHAEDTESIRRYHTIRVDDINPRSLASLGVFDPLSLAALLALRAV